MSDLRKGVTTIGFRIESSHATEAAVDIVERLNEGQLEEHGVLRAQVASFGSEAESSAEITVSPYLRNSVWSDRVLAAVLLVLFFPVIVVLMALIKLTSPGPVLFQQRRVGKDGDEFTMFKLRTMRVDAEAASGPVWSLAEDPRITVVGKYLRRHSLDELPQIFNVLRGEMAFIGPRPERPEFTEVLEKSIPNYGSRLLVKPGIFGLHTPNLPPDSSIEDVRKKLLVDRFYIQHATFSLDAKIALDCYARILGLRWRLTKRLVDKALSVGLDRPGEGATSMMPY